MSDQETDLFGFTKEGFHTGYSRLTRPPTREQRLADLDAQREAGAKSQAVNSVIGGVPAAPVTGTPAPLDEFRAFLKSASDEDLKALSDAQLDEELERGIIARSPVLTDADEWGDE
jgi:hypothetical protein